LLVISRSHMYLLQSSTSRRKYRLPPCVAGVIGPHRSLWMSLRASAALYFTGLGNATASASPPGSRRRAHRHAWCTASRAPSSRAA
jgi:hypothetical protein